MPERKELYGELRPWIAAAIGAGLVVAGIAMAVGMRSVYAPLVGVGVTSLVLAVVNRRLKQRQRSG